MCEFCPPGDGQCPWEGMPRVSEMSHADGLEYLIAICNRNEIESANENALAEVWERKGWE